MILPYYKIERTNKGKEFFYSHIGYFNFWNEYLIANTEGSKAKIFHLLVNRTGMKFSNPTTTEEQEECIKNAIADSVCIRKPEDMFKDFPELEKYNWLKKYSKYYIEESSI